MHEFWKLPAGSPERKAAQRAYGSLHYAANKESICARKRVSRKTFRDTNHELFRERERAYVATNRDQVNAQQRAFRAGRRAMFYTGTCADGCGTTENLERDHLIPETKIANVGVLLTHRLDVLQTEVEKTELVCRPCHAKRGAARRLDRSA